MYGCGLILQLASTFGAIWPAGGKGGVDAAECTSLSLTDKGIQQISGFDKFHNLSVLVLSRNKLTKIDNLDTNFRIRTLIAQGNQICTLKGSLVHMRLLQQLDLSNNRLRNLQKIAQSLKCFEFLETLNLKGTAFISHCVGGLF